LTKSNKFIRLCIGVILVLLIVYLVSLVDFIFKPIFSLFSMMIMVPFLLAGFFYYILRPLVDLMERKKVTRTLAIMIIYVVVVICIVGFIIGLWPPLVAQLTNLVSNAPSLFTTLSDQLRELEQKGFLSAILPDNVSPLTQLTNYLNKGFTFLTDCISGMVSFFSNFAIILFTFPIFLFYMLKEGGKFGKRIVSFIPKRFREDGIEVIGEIDNALSGFIVGRVIVNVALGILMYIGFLIIGLPYALLLTVVAVILNFIPFVGAILSSIPILIIGFVESPSVAIWSLVVILVAQQLQDNIIGPYIFGKQLDIHPLTTIILVLAGGDLFGIFGIIVIIPVYMTIKIIVSKVYTRFLKDSWEEV
jgi:predicted PurR-regulated permease PerM